MVVAEVEARKSWMTAVHERCKDGRRCSIIFSLLVVGLCLCLGLAIQPRGNSIAFLTPAAPPPPPRALGALRAAGAKCDVLVLETK